MDDRDFRAFEAGVRNAEAACARGEYRVALETYRNLLDARLAAGGGWTAELRSADLMVADRLADLSVLFGRFDVADDLLTAIVRLTRSARNDVAADYAQLKRAELALARSGLHDAYDRLRELESRIGDLTEIEMSATGLERWEKSTAWRDFHADDRQVQFSRTYYLMARLLAASGQYHQAICAAERSEVYTGANAVDLARQARIPIALTRAAALFELGDLRAAEEVLQGLRRAIDEAGQPGWRVGWLESCGRLDFARGEYGNAVAHFNTVLELCGAGGFRQAAVTANLNIAHVLILLNRIRDALDHLDDAEHDAQCLGDVGAHALERLRFLRQAADARRRSVGDAISLELSLTEILRGERPRGSTEPNLASSATIDLPQSSNYLTLFEDRAFALRWSIADRQWAPAASRLSELKQSFGTSQSRLILARLNVLQALLAYSQGKAESDQGLVESAMSRFESAMGLLDFAASQLSEMQLRPELWQVLQMQGWCAARLGKKSEEQTFVARAERLLEEIARSLGGAYRAIFLLNKWTIEKEHLNHEIERLIHAKAALLRTPYLLRPFAWLKIARHLNHLLGRIDRHKELLAQTAVGTGSNAGTHRSAPSLLKRLLSVERGRVVVSFLVLPNCILVVQSGFCHLHFDVSATTRIELREQVGRWHELMHESATTRDLGARPATPPALGADRHRYG